MCINGKSAGRKTSGGKQENLFFCFLQANIHIWDQARKHVTYRYSDYYKQFSLLKRDNIKMVLKFKHKFDISVDFYNQNITFLKSEIIEKNREYQ